MVSKLRERIARIRNADTDDHHLHWVAACSMMGLLVAAIYWFIHLNAPGLQLVGVMFMVTAAILGAIVVSRRGHIVTAMFGVYLVLHVAAACLGVIEPDLLAMATLIQVLTFGFVMSYLPDAWHRALAAGTVLIVTIGAFFVHVIFHHDESRTVLDELFVVLATFIAAIAGVIVMQRIEASRRGALKVAQAKVAARTRELGVERDRALLNTQYLELLNQISVGMLHQHGSDDLLRTLLDGACRLLKIEDGEIRTLKTGPGSNDVPEMFPACSLGKFANRSISTARGRGMVGRAWDQGRLQHVEDYRIWPPRLTEDDNDWLRAVACAPILVDGMVTGTLLVARTDDSQFTSLDLAYLERLAQLGALVLQNLTSLEVARREVRDREATEAVLQRQTLYLSALNDTTVELMRRPDLGRVFEDILGRACTLVNAAGGYVMMVNPAGDALELKTVHGVETLRTVTRRAMGEGMSGTVWATGKSIKLDDYARWPHRLLDRTAPSQIKCTMCVPLITDGAIAGVIGVVRTDKVGGFSDEDLAVLERFARLASVAYLNARLYQDVQQQRDFAAAILTNMNQAVAVIGLDGRFKYANPANEKMVGYTAEEFIGKHVSDILDMRDMPRLMRDVRRFRDADVSIAEYGFVHKNGHAVRLRVSSVPRIENGTVTGSISVADDVTAQLEAEEKMRKAHDQALEASRLKSRFMATMSHEIRTPMNAILGLTELALDDPALTPDLRDLIGTAHESSQALNSLITDMLDYSKLEAGKLDLSIEPINVSTHAAKIMAMFETRARSQNISMTLRVAPDIPEMVQTDATRLRQVLTNLLGNAEKFTHAGSVDLHISVSGDASAPGRFLLFQVVDTGIGISPEVQATLFEPFRQGDSSTTREYGGTGLGLAICKNLVELMGGMIGVDSRPNVGSTFWFTLPIVEHLATRDGIYRQISSIDG